MSRRADEPTWLDSILERLGIPGRTSVSLDEIGEAIGGDWVTPLDIERVFEAIESHGARVGDEARASLAPLLGQVLKAARALRVAGGVVTPSSVAAASGLEEREVRVALLYAEVLARGR